MDSIEAHVLSNLIRQTGGAAYARPAKAKWDEPFAAYCVQVDAWNREHWLSIQYTPPPEKRLAFDQSCYDPRSIDHCDDLPRVGKVAMRLAVDCEVQKAFRSSSLLIYEPLSQDAARWAAFALGAPVYCVPTWMTKSSTGCGWRVAPDGECLRLEYKRGQQGNGFLYGFDLSSLRKVDHLGCGTPSVYLSGYARLAFEAAFAAGHTPKDS